MVDAPFYRFPLMEGRPLTAPPANISVEDWQNFWDRFEPLLETKSSGRYQSFWRGLGVFFFGGILATALVFCVPYGSNHRDVKGLLVSLGFIACVSLVLYLLFVCVCYVKHTKLQQYQQFLRDCTFPGYQLECRLLSGTIAPTPTQALHLFGYYLYFFPTQPQPNGEQDFEELYLSLEICPERLTCGDIRTNSKDLLYSEQDYLPSGLETIPINDWKEFWERLDRNSDEYKSTMRKYLACLLVFCAFLFWSFCDSNLDDTLNDMGLWWFGFVLFVASFGGMYYYESQLAPLERQLAQLLEEYQVLFATQHVYLEACRVSTFHWFAGGISRRYLFFYPLRQGNQV